eukprot:scaffold127602_cov60-Cyclotella_meneghiniana.AAC.5
MQSHDKESRASLILMIWLHNNNSTITRNIFKLAPIRFNHIKININSHRPSNNRAIDTRAHHISDAYVMPIILNAVTSCSSSLIFGLVAGVVRLSGVDDDGVTTYCWRWEMGGGENDVLVVIIVSKGHEWVVTISLPYVLRTGDQDRVRIILESTFEAALTVDYDLHVRGLETQSFSSVTFPRERVWDRCWSDIRTDVLNYAFECWRSHSGKPILNNKDDADVAFDVKGQLFYAHKIILKGRAPDLVADFCDSCDKSNPVPIQDVEPVIFKAMLGHAYAKNIDPTVWKEHTKGIIEASVKYGFTELKSDAEAWYTESKNLTVDTVIDELLYADSYNLKVLKEATMDFIVEHGREVLASDTYDRLDESPKLRKEVMGASFEYNRKRQRDEDSSLDEDEDED